MQTICFNESMLFEQTKTNLDRRPSTKTCDIARKQTISFEFIVASLQFLLRHSLMPFAADAISMGEKHQASFDAAAKKHCSESLI